MALPSYLHKNPLLRMMARYRVRVLASRLRRYLRPENAVMDYGCGLGVLFPTLAATAKTLYGVDLELGPARMTAKYCGLDNVRFCTPDAMATTIQKASLEAIVCGEVLEHIDDMTGLMAIFQNLLTKDGRLVVTLPTENWAYRFGRKLAGFHGHYHLHDAMALDRKIQSHGFVPVFRKKIPLPGPLAIYWLVEYSFSRA